MIKVTGTQLLPSDSDDEIINTLNPFQLYCQDHVTDKYSSMAVCTRSTVEVRICEYFPSINALKYEVVNYKSKEMRNILLLYRKQNSNVSQYIECLQYLLTSTTVDIVLGDFNFNYFNDNQVEHLRSLMQDKNMFTKAVTWHEKNTLAYDRFICSNLPQARIPL